MVRFLERDIRGFLKEEVKTYQMAPTSPLNSQTFFSVFASIVYGFQSVCAHGCDLPVHRSLCTIYLCVFYCFVHFLLWLLCVRHLVACSFLDYVWCWRDVPHWRRRVGRPAKHERKLASLQNARLLAGVVTFELIDHWTQWTVESRSLLRSS